MFSVTVSVCKQLIRSKSCRLIYSSASVKTNGSHSQVELPLDKLDLSEITRSNPEDIFRTMRYIKKIDLNENVDWESLTKKLTEENIRNPTTKIFQACIRLDNVRLAEKFHNYLTEKRYQWTVFDKIYFCKVLLKHKSLIPDYEDVFVSLYKQVKPLLHSSTLIQGYLSELFVEIPHLYEKLINDQVSTSCVANKAAELYDIEKAFEVIECNIVKNFNQDFFIKCAKACVENAKDGKFSIDFMNKLVEFCTKCTVTVNTETCLEIFKSMFKNLNLHDSNYHWSVEDCIIDHENICSSCQLALKPNTLSVDEFEEMRDDFLNNVILKNSYIYSNDSELQEFLNFLKNSKPYDLVIDILNVIHLRKLTGVQMAHHYINHYLIQGRSIFVVSRNHIKKFILKPSFMKYKKYQDRLQFFFTENISNDDIFILYSALHSGPNTQVLTKDLLRNHSCKLSKINRSRFLRWQMSNQYCIGQHLDAGRCVSHCNLSQLTHTPTQQNEKYVWHISHHPSHEVLLRRMPVKWICVTATKRK